MHKMTIVGEFEPMKTPVTSVFRSIKEPPLHPDSSRLTRFYTVCFVHLNRNKSKYVRQNVSLH